MKTRKTINMLTYIVMIFSLISSLNLVAQDYNWTKFTRAADIWDMAREDDKIWIATKDGLIEYNSVTKEKKITTLVILLYLKME